MKIGENFVWFERFQSTFLKNPRKLVFEWWILHFEFLDEISRINRIIVLTPPGSTDLPQRSYSFTIRIIMQRQHYFPSSLLVNELLAILSILSTMTSPRNFYDINSFTNRYACSFLFYRSSSNYLYSLQLSKFTCEQF